MTDPGLALTDSEVSAAVAVRLDDTPSEFWNTLADDTGFWTRLVEAVRTTAAGHTWQDYHDRLEDAGVDAHHGSYRSLCARVARGDWRGIRQLVNATRLESRTSLADVRSGAPRVFALADDVTPTIAVYLHEDTRDLTLDQRREICRLLEALAQGCDIKIVGSRIELQWFVTEHAPYLPSVSTTAITPLPEEAPSEQVEQAKQAYDADSPAVEVLRWLANEDSEELSRSALLSRLPASRSTLSQYLNGQGSNDQGLLDYELVERVGPRGDWYLRLLPAGREFLDWLDTETARQRTLDEALEPVLDSPTQNRTTRAPTRGGTGEATAATATASAATPQGPHRISRLPEWEAVAARESSPENGVSVVDYPIQPQENSRSPRRRYLEADDTLVVGAETKGSHSALKMWVCLAKALAGHSVWREVLDNGRRLEDDDRFHELFTEFRETLRGSYGLGFLPDDMVSVDEFQDRILEAVQHLGELTRDYHAGDYDGDRDEFRSEITTQAMGVATTMKAVLELAGVEVVVEFRAPDLNQSFEDSDREAFVETIVNAVVKWSRYRHSNAYKQLFEDDEENRERAIEASVDYSDPVGQLPGRITVVGDFNGCLGEFTERLRTRLAAPDEVHEDAPEFQIEVPVVSSREFDRDVFVAAVERMCRARNLRPTREAVSVYRLFCETPYDAAAAVNGLRREPERRAIRLDEVRVSLARVSEARVMSWEAPSVGRLVETLLAARDPLSVTDLCDQAGVDRSTWYDYVEMFEALGLVSETDTCVRLVLPFKGSDEYDVRPWFVEGEGESDLPLPVLLRSLGYRLATQCLPDGERGEFLVELRSGWAVDPEVVTGRWPWVEDWLPVLRDIAGDPVEPPEPVVFGQPAGQASLQAAASGGASA